MDKINVMFVYIFLKEFMSTLDNENILNYKSENFNQSSILQ